MQTDDAVMQVSEDAAYRVLPRGVWRLFSVALLFFLVFPFVGLRQTRQGTAALVVALVAAVIFVAIYLWLMLYRPFPTAEIASTAVWVRLSLIVALAAVVFFLTVINSRDWYWFFIYTGFTAGVALPARGAAGTLAPLLALAAGSGVPLVGWLQTGRIVVLVALAGFGMIGVGRFVATIAALRAARAEIARLAVAAERLRFARDLHDLLGHSLSTIAVKTALARRLLPATPERAMRELDDVQAVTQEALTEVREAVAGYRRPALATELVNAREMLIAAGITCQCENTAGALPPAVESVLAWAVREGVTNVVRHSRARRVTIRVHRSDDTARAEIADDGVGKTADADGNRVSGSGLRGLAERAAVVGGTLDARRHDGGFRLAVTLPLDGARHAGVPVETGPVG